MKYVVLSFFCLILFSCGKITPKGTIQSKDIDVSEFNGLSFSGKFRVFFVRSSKNFVNVESYENIAENLDIDVSDKILNISEKRGVKNVDFYNITIYSKNNPTSIEVSDSVEVNISSEINTDHLKVNLKNNAKFIGSVKTQKTYVVMSGSSLANFRGFTKNVTMKIADTSGVIAPYWYIDNLDINEENGSYAEVNVKDTLKGNIKNTSKFLYYNDPIRAFKIDKEAKVNNKKID